MNKKKLIEKIHALSYMQASLGLFSVSLLILICLSVKAVSGSAALSYGDGIMGIVSLILSMAGFAVPLYGHFIVKAECRLDWRLGTVLNGCLMLLLVFLYGLGL